MSDLSRIINQLALIFCVLISLSACENGRAYTYKKSLTAMDTYITITVVSDSPKKAGRAIDAAFAEIQRLESILSFWLPGSEIAAINRSAGVSPVTVSDDTMDIARTSLEIARKTDGAFDPTVGPLMRLWDFRQNILPGSAQIEATLSLTDFRKVEMEEPNQTIYLSTPGMSFDTGGIAKGYASDRAIEVLRENGITSALVAVAGDIRAMGLREDGKPWRVGIRDPRSENPEDIIAWLELRDEAISTSGDYERYFIKDGVRYHHILDPRTGYPARGLVSVSVIAPLSVLSDGYSTGLFVLGPEKAPPRLKSLGLEGLIIDEKGEAHVTDGIKWRLQWVSAKYKKA